MSSSAIYKYKSSEKESEIIPIMRTYQMIVAFAKNYAIGKGGEIPWKLSNDMKHFSKITRKTFYGEKCEINVVIMGRKTWDSIPLKYKPLPRRINVILTHQIEWESNVDSEYDKFIIHASSILNAFDQIERIEKDKKFKIGNIFIIGGESIYKECLHKYSDYCKDIFVTEVNKEIKDCDAFFTPIPSYYKEIKHPDVETDEIQEENGIQYKFKVYRNEKFIYNRSE